MSLSEDEDLALAAKVAFTLRLARTALGLNQAEFGTLMDVSKPTIVRLETMESPVKLAFYAKMVKRLTERGIHVDAITSEGVKIEVDQAAVEKLIQQVDQEKQLRSKRFKNVGTLFDESADVKKKE
jgi:transcriptional regulator with XRE-family HTH domain